MRPITKKGLASLSDKNRKEILQEHIPYRLSLLRDGYRAPWTPPCQHTNMAFEAGAVSCRLLLSFLGIACNRKTGELREDQEHESLDKRTTDDVKATDVGGHFAQIEALTPSEQSVLADFIRGVNKACAHFTIETDHKLDLCLYASAAEIVFRLMTTSFPLESKSWPRWNG